MSNVSNEFLSVKSLKKRSPWASSSDPFLCYEGFHVPHSSGLQEASISGSQPKASSMYGLALYELSYEVVSLFIKV